MKIVYLMRGLPSSGKTFTARRLAGEHGLVLETDQYFHSEVGEDPGHYDYSDQLLADARRWNFARFAQAIVDGISPIVVDRGNSLSVETQRYARCALDYGYRVELKEPDSEWWQEIRVLLKYKDITREILYEWADRLADMSRSMHRVSADTIRHRMDHWKHDLTVDDIIAARFGSCNSAPNASLSGSSPPGDSPSRC